MSIYRLSPVVLIAGIVFATQFANRLVRKTFFVTEILVSN